MSNFLNRLIDRVRPPCLPFARPSLSLAVLFALAVWICPCGTLRAQAPTKPVLVHYMPWFVAKPYSTYWGWHWTMNHYNPDTTNASGQRQIASWYYPLIGPYDSADPAVLEYHVLLMKLAGIDGVIVDWYGQDSYADYGINNARTVALFNYTRRAQLSFSLCYEDSTIQNEINGNYIYATGAVAHAQQTLLYAQNTFFVDPSYLRWNNQPVFLNFGPQYFKTNSQWQSIFSVLNATNQPAFFTEDNKLPVCAGAFDWPPMWMSQNGVLSSGQMESYLANFQQNAASWPAFISSAFPRFHDIYAQAGVGASYGYLDDNNGNTLRATLGRALTNASAFVQVVTWNDYGEGTIVEPTVDFGYRDLGILQDFRRQYLDPAFAWHTNDLTLAYRVYSMRRQYKANTIVSAELDRVFTNVVSGDLATSSLQLTGIESGRPAVYGVSAESGQLQFTIGGYISAAGVEIQCSSDLTPASWQSVATLPASTGVLTFSTPLVLDTAPKFFRVHSLGP